MSDDHFAIDDDGSGDIKRAGNHREPCCPVQPVTGEDLLPSPVDVDLDAVAVELDFVKPLLTLRRFGLQRCKLGLNEPRHRDWIRHNATRKQKRPRAWRSTTGILAYFSGIPNQSGDVIFPATTNAVGHIEEVFAVAQRLLGIVDGDSVIAWTCWIAPTFARS